jgi:hypothetical protein
VCTVGATCSTPCAVPDVCCNGTCCDRLLCENNQC